MADIVESDVKLYKSEDQTDTDTGGGRMSSDVIVSGVLNNLFSNISRIDRLKGRIQLRKFFQKIDSANTGVYSGAHIIIRDIPADENVSILLFDTNDPNDHLPDITDYVESYFEKSTPAGNAGLEYAVKAGGRQLVFKIRDYEYTPIYDKDGNLVYTKKVDAKYALNVTVGDLLVLDDGAGTEEFVQVEQLERVTENLDNADAKHYYTVEYVIITVSADLINPFPAGIVPYRTVKNPAWKCYGAMMLGADALSEDDAVIVESSKCRLAPTISRDISVSDASFFGPPEIVDGVSVGADGITWTLDQAEQIHVSESITAIAGKSSYTHPLANRPLKASSLQIWYRSNLGWFVITETDGVLSGDGSGTVSADDIVSMTCAYPPDPDTDIIFYFTREHNFTVNEGVDLTNPNIVYNSEQVAVPAETQTATGTIDKHPVQAGYVKLSVDLQDGNGFVPLGADSGQGVITGDNIDAATFDYFTGQWSVRLKAVYTSGVVFKWQYIPLQVDAYINQMSIWPVGTTNGFSTFNDSVFLGRENIQPGTVSITIRAYWRLNTMSALQTSQIVLNDDGNGLLIKASGDAAANGTIDYAAGTAGISFDFSSITPIIYGASKYIVNFYCYSNAVYSQASLPYEFTIGSDQALVGSLLVKYFTDGIDTPWYAKADGSGNLNLVASMTAWSTGTDIADLSFVTSRPIYIDALFVSGQWVMVMGQQIDGGTMILTSADGDVWSGVYTNTPFGMEWKNFRRLAYNPSSGVWIVVGQGSHSTGTYPLIGKTTDFSGWTWPSAGSAGEQFVDVVFSAPIGKFLAIESGKIFTSGDDGDTWDQQTTKITSMSVAAAETLSAVPMILVFGHASQHQYSTDGSTWTQGVSKLNGQATACAAMNVNGVKTVFAADDQGNVVSTTDGIHFTLCTACSGPVTSLSTDGAMYLAATLDDGSIDISEDFGASWGNQPASDNQWANLMTNRLFFSDELGWLHLSAGYDAGTPAIRPETMPFNIMTDENGDAIKKIGTFDPDTGTGEISDGLLPTVAQARYFLTPRRLSTFIVTTWGAAPVHDNTFVAMGQTYTGALLMLQEDSENPGVLVGDGTGSIDKAAGVAQLGFSFTVRPDSIRLSYAYGSIYRPEYTQINTRAMPLDGMVPVVTAGDTAVLVEFARSKLTADITDSEMAIDVKNGAIFPDREVTVKIDDEEILGTMSADTFAVTTRGYNGTTAAAHLADAVMELTSRKEEMLPVLTVAGNRITTPNKLANDYKAGGALLTTAIVKGDLSARVTDYHTEQFWDGSTWKDSGDYTGNPADGTYDTTNFFILVTNQGATTERWIFQVKSLAPVKVDIRGEHLGVIATDQDTTSDIAPINPNTGAPYLTIRSGGWGAGWQVGNILRPNTQAAGGPAWGCRVINARASETIDDYATIQSRGDVAV